MIPEVDTWQYVLYFDGRDYHVKNMNSLANDSLFYFCKFSRAYPLPRDCEIPQSPDDDF